MQSTDEQVVLDALEARDHRRAIQLLMERYGRAIYALCCRMLRDRALADDMLQETFSQAYRDLDTWKRENTLKSWLFSIAAHRCLDAIKARSRRDVRFVSEEAGPVASSDVDPGDRIDATLQARALEECLAQLAGEVRLMVLLRFREDRSFEDLGKMCQKKPDTVRASVVRALPLLRRCLEGKGITL